MRTEPYRPGCSTVAVYLFGHSRVADLISWQVGCHWVRLTHPHNLACRVPRHNLRTLRYPLFSIRERGAEQERTASVQGDKFVVGKLDRFGRSLQELIELVGVLKVRGVEFVSLRESLDTTTPGGKLVFHVFGAVAEFERDLIRERTMAGLEAAKARGRRGGRPLHDSHFSPKNVVPGLRWARATSSSSSSPCPEPSVRRMNPSLITGPPLTRSPHHSTSRP